MSAASNVSSAFLALRCSARRSARYVRSLTRLSGPWASPCAVAFASAKPVSVARAPMKRAIVSRTGFCVSRKPTTDANSTGSGVHRSQAPEIDAPKAATSAPISTTSRWIDSRSPGWGRASNGNSSPSRPSRRSASSSSVTSAFASRPSPSNATITRAIAAFHTAQLMPCTPSKTDCSASCTRSPSSAPWPRSSMCARPLPTHTRR